MCVWWKFHSLGCLEQKKKKCKEKQKFSFSIFLLYFHGVIKKNDKGEDENEVKEILRI